MMEQSKRERFEELDAGRVLGDLDAAEWEEWNALASDLRRGADSGLDLLAAELEVALGRSAEPMPEGLAEKLRSRLETPDNISSFPSPDEKERPRARFSFPPWLGWAVAACLLGWIALRPGPGTGLKPDGRRQALVQSASDLVKAGFQGTAGRYAQASGEVVWSDAKQEGYMRLDHLPPNDASRQQYQLWIVDPSRDEIPVDGGVFDIPQGGTSVVVPIAAKLAVQHPAVFVITLEKPGGVVRSKQEVVVAVAKS